MNTSESNKFALTQYAGTATDYDFYRYNMGNRNSPVTPIGAHVDFPQPYRGRYSENETVVPYAQTEALTLYNLPPPPDTKKMKKIRKRGTVVAGVVGGTVGLIALGPLGALGFGTASAIVVKQSGKARERRAMRRYDARITQEMAQSSRVHVGSYA